MLNHESTKDGILQFYYNNIWFVSVKSFNENINVILDLVVQT